jgi:hypothetical protein
MIPTDLRAARIRRRLTPVSRVRVAGLVARVRRRPGAGATAMLEAGLLLGYARHGARSFPGIDVDLLVEDAAFARVMDVLADDRDLRVAS